MHILFCRHIWAELSLLFWTFLSGTFFPGGGGGCTCTQCTPPCVRACLRCLCQNVFTVRSPCYGIEFYSSENCCYGYQIQINNQFMPILFNFMVFSNTQNRDGWTVCTPSHPRTHNYKKIRCTSQFPVPSVLSRQNGELDAKS